MKSDKKQLISRGYAEEESLEKFKNFNKLELLELLKSKIPTQRTIAAKLLANYQEESVIVQLIESLEMESKLYSKIAISETLSSFKEEAAQHLVFKLGLIGNNQHKELPEKPFKKNNYPLPRDIVARTLSNTGTEALSSLKMILSKGDYQQKLEAVDAVGFISFYNDGESLLEELLSLFTEYKSDKLMIWKLLRSLQSFRNEESIAKLSEYRNSDIKQHKWEALRSLKQIENYMNKIY